MRWVRAELRHAVPGTFEDGVVTRKADGRTVFVIWRFIIHGRFAWIDKKVANVPAGARGNRHNTRLVRGGFRKALALKRAENDGIANYRSGKNARQLSMINPKLLRQMTGRKRREE